MRKFIVGIAFLALSACATNRELYINENGETVYQADCGGMRQDMNMGDYSAFAPFTAALAYMPPAYFRLPAPCSQTLSSEGSNPNLYSLFTTKLPRGEFCCKWRIERDSNPRYALDVHTISNRAPSTTRPSIQGDILFILFCGTWQELFF